MTLDKFFERQAESRRLFDALQQMIDAAGPSTIHITKSQISFGRRRRFAWAWMPRKVLRGRGALLVLTLALPERDPSPRWKEIVEPAPGRFTHHLELNTVLDLDGEVRTFIRRAWEHAG